MSSSAGRGARRSPASGPGPGTDAGRAASAGHDGTDDDALLPAPTAVPDGVPVSELVTLTPPEQVVRAALARAKAAARARGLRPGVVRSRPLSSGAGAGPRDPQPLAISAGLLARDLGWEPGLMVGDLVHRWAQIVGQQVADHCEYTSFTSGLLTVRASSTAWAANLRLLTPAMLARFDEVLGEGVVVQIEVLGPVGHGFGRGPRRVAGRGPRDTYG